MNKWQDPSLSLGERCVEFAKNEMANGVSEDRPNSFTSPRIREYFSICTRLVNGKETPIGLTFKAGNWCSAGVSFSLHESLLPGEPMPHGYRLGVIEVITDFQRRGAYRSIADVRQGRYQIKVGDPVFFDRSNPANPASAWWRHIGLVHSVGPDGTFVCISGNNGGRWRLSNHNLNQKSLLGFGDYPSLPLAIPVILPPNEPVVDPNIGNNFPVDNGHDNVDIVSLAPPIDTGKKIGVNALVEFFNQILRFFRR